MLDIACNDPDNGCFIGRAPWLQIGSIEFEARRSEPKIVELASGDIRLAGKTWPVSRSKEWYGNWCWNRYLISDGTQTPQLWLADFIFWLWKRDLYRVSCGPDKFGLWFNRSFKEMELRKPQIASYVCEALEGRNP